MGVAFTLDDSDWESLGAAVPDLYLNRRIALLDGSNDMARLDANDLAVLLNVSRRQVEQLTESR
jgi:hypothetical protein